jgi:alkylation response protein AidB-like acyl-CoA dehydrogenase
MDVRLSPEQRALRDSAVQVVDRLGLHAVRDLDDDERTAKLEAAVTAAGWRELRAVADDGTPWASAVEVAIVAEELGRRLADTAFLGPTLAADLRRRTGAPAATPAETIALAPDLAGPPALGATPIAVDAAGAFSAVLLLPVDRGHTVGTISLGPAAVATDLTRPLARPVDGASVSSLDAQTRHLDEDDLAAWTALGLAVTCADLVGTMRGAISLGTEYATERRQYGRSVGSFQAVQHLLADALVALEGARSTALHAAWAVDALPPDEALAAGALAKAWCARAARSVCETVIQVHGGIGNTWDCLAHVYLRRALVSIDLFGGVGASLERVLAHHGIGAGVGLR